MLARIDDLGPGVCRARCDNLWDDDLSRRVSAAITPFYGDACPDGFYPHFNEGALRAALLDAAPELCGLRDAYAELLGRGYTAVIVDELHLRERPAAVRSRLLFALCLALGFPTPSDQRDGTLLWPVRAAPAGDDPARGYSAEHDGAMDLHTDSPAYPAPEEHFVLYAERAARCGGGASLFCSAAELRESLAASARGREALEALGALKFPFAHAPGGLGAVTAAPILGARPAVRFARAAVEQGFGARPELATRAAREALRTLVETLAMRARVVRRYLPDGAAALCDNHALLHGRTRFADGARVVLRARMRARPFAVHAAAIAPARPAAPPSPAAAAG